MNQQPGYSWPTNCDPQLKLAVLTTILMSAIEYLTVPFCFTGLFPYAVAIDHLSFIRFTCFATDFLSPLTFEIYQIKRQIFVRVFKSVALLHPNLLLCGLFYVIFYF